jgi:hypothetical protein
MLSSRVDPGNSHKSAVGASVERLKAGNETLTGKLVRHPSLNGEGGEPIQPKQKSESFRHNSHKQCEVSSVNLGFFIF